VKQDDKVRRALAAEEMEPQTVVNEETIPLYETNLHFFHVGTWTPVSE
jgi:hypothetical protein